MRPTVWASFISGLHPELGQAAVMHQEVYTLGFMVDRKQSSAVLTPSGYKLQIHFSPVLCIGNHLKDPTEIKSILF